MLVIITYVVYLTVSVALTVWVGRALFNNGRVFLVDIFRGNEALAGSVNQLLLVGFYLVNLGYVVLTLATSGDIATARVAIEKLSLKVGMVLLILGAMHYTNLLMFSRMRRRAEIDRSPPLFPNDASRAARTRDVPCST